MSGDQTFSILTPVFFDKKSGTRRRIEKQKIDEDDDGEDEFDNFLCEGSSSLLPGDSWKKVRVATDADWKDATGL